MDCRLVVAVVAIVSPLDGPLGDVAAIGALSGALSQYNNIGF